MDASRAARPTVTPSGDPPLTAGGTRKHGFPQGQSRTKERPGIRVSLAQRISDEAERRSDYARKFREDLTMHPELSGEEHRTTAQIMAAL